MTETKKERQKENTGGGSRHTRPHTEAQPQIAQERKMNRELVAKRVRGTAPLVSDVKSYFTRSSAGLKAVKLIVVFNVQCNS